MADLFRSDFVRLAHAYGVLNRGTAGQQFPSLQGHWDGRDFEPNETSE